MTPRASLGDRVQGKVLLIHINAVITPGPSILAALPVFRLDAAALWAVFVVVINVSLLGLLFSNRMVWVAFNSHGCSLRVGVTSRCILIGATAFKGRKSRRHLHQFGLMFQLSQFLTKVLDADLSLGPVEVDSLSEHEDVV